MENKSTERLKITTFKLNSLLSITQAINDNLSVTELLQHYEKILTDDLDIGKIMLIKHNNEWECILRSGFPPDTLSNLNAEKDLLPFSDITFITSTNHHHLEAIDIVIPVYNNNAPLAFVLIGDIDEEGKGVSPTIKHLHFIQTLSNIIIVAIENQRLFKESLKQEALKKEMELATRMQTMLIPDSNSLPKNDSVHFVSFYQPHLNVGGDYYDVIQLNDHEVGFCIADVSGKGMPAAILMSNFQANLQALFTQEISLELLVQKLNDRVIKNAKGEKFITLFIARYNYQTKELQYINAAHNPPILYNVMSQTPELLKHGSVGIGMLDEIPVIKKGVVQIQHHSKLLCYTDGLIEMMDEKNITNTDDTLEKYVINNDTIEMNIKRILKDQNITHDNPAFFDDITMLGVEFF